MDIIEAGFDAGLRLESIIPQDMVAISLGIPEGMFIVASQEYIKLHGEPKTPGDLLGNECIHPSKWEHYELGDAKARGVC